jgi:glycosyltransferase involved in cell wall biosynthesis
MWIPVLWLILHLAARAALNPLAAWLYALVAAKPARTAFAGCDIIHHIGEAAPLNGFAAAEAARVWRIPFIAQPTCHPHHVGDSPLDLRLFFQADRLLVHTRYEANYFREKLYRRPIDVVGNGIVDRNDGDSQRFRSRHGINGPFILYLGRKDRQKGYYLLLDAFKIVHRQRPDIRLCCMGPLTSDDGQPNIKGVFDLDFVSEGDKHDALAACSCLCVPSVGESFGLVFMEAGRYAKPVVGRNVPVLRELWKEGEAGLLLGVPEDGQNSANLDASELAAALLKLLSDDSECLRLGASLRDTSEQFLWTAIVERFEASYYRALDGCVAQALVRKDPN